MQELPPTLEEYLVIILIKIVSIAILVILVSRLLNRLCECIKRESEEAKKPPSEKTKMCESIYHSYLIHPSPWKWLVRLLILASFTLAGIVGGWYWPGYVHLSIVAVFLVLGVIIAWLFKMPVINNEEL